MRSGDWKKKLMLFLFLVLALSCAAAPFVTAARAGDGFSPVCERQRQCVLEAGRQARHFNAALSKPEGTRVLELLRAQGTRVLGGLDSFAPCDDAGALKPDSPAVGTSLQTKLHQNRVARK